MTQEEEDKFRAAARQALQQAKDILMVAATEDWNVPCFTIIRFERKDTLGIVVPASWEHQEGMEERCHGILRQENKALSGEALD